MEQKGEASRHLKVFEQNGFFVTAEFSGGKTSGAAQLRKLRFRAGSMKNHEIKQSKLGSVVKSSKTVAGT